MRCALNRDAPSLSRSVVGITDNLTIVTHLGVHCLLDINYGAVAVSFSLKWSIIKDYCVPLQFEIKQSSITG